MKRIFLVMLAFCLFIGSYAQDTIKPANRFKITPTLTSYSGYQKSLCSDSASFQQDKFMFGASVIFSTHWSAMVVLDFVNFEDPNSKKMNAYFKPAKLTYRNGKLTVDAGIIFLTQYDYHTRNWGNRFVAKVFQDKYGFGNIADLGIQASYKWSDFLITDIALVSGKGHKLLDFRTPYKPSIRVTAFPAKDLSVLFYYDYMKEGIAQQALASMIDFRLGKRISLTGEYNAKFNFSFLKNYVLHGTSIYSNYYINKKLGLLARYDYLTSHFSGSYTPTMLKRDGSSVIAGFQYRIFSIARVSLSYQNWIPRNFSFENQHWLYAAVEIKY